MSDTSVDTTANPSNPQVPDPGAPPVAATPPAASAPATTGDTPADTPSEPDKGKPDAGLQKAINRLTRQRGDAERRAMRLEAELEAIRKVGTPQPPAKSAELRVEDFPNYDAYAKAIAREEATKAAEEVVRAESDKRLKGEAQEAADRQQQTFLREAGKQAEAVGIDFDSAWETLRQAPLVSPAVASFIYESEHPAQLVEFLADNPDELDRVSRLSPAAAFRSLVKVEAGFPAKPASNATRAPPPVPTVGGRAVTQVDPDKMSMDEYAKHFHARRAKRA